MALAAGTKIGPYEIVSALGSGGMGEVYRARDVRLGRMVALKIIGSAVGATDVQRFELEARATSAINHPHIVALYDVGEYRGAPYLVTELLEGETLASRLARGPVPAAKAVEYARQIASGLVAAHERAIVHRDLKPANIFITADGHVKILDFGIAKMKLSAAAEALTGHLNAGLTSTGSIVGTVSYMSPEQVRGEEVDLRSDVFSFGAVLYEMLTARAAFQQPTAAETMHAILHSEPELDAIKAAPVAFIVRQCLAKNPRERFQSTRDLELYLSALTSGWVSTSTAVAAGVAIKRRRWMLPAAAAVAAALLIGAGAWAMVGWRGGATMPPDYRQLTFRRGFVDAARFTGDGHTVVYSASWDGAPIQLLSMRLESPEFRELNLRAATLLAVSSSGEVAVSLNSQRLSRLLGVGTLARLPIVGGTPREVMKDVVQADWSPDGSALAVIRKVNGKFRLEYPIGKMLYENTGGLADVRVSRNGLSVAFTEHPALPDDRGDICLVGADGVKRVVSAGWASVSGLAWSPQGDEIWFTASEVGQNTSLWAVTPLGVKRLLMRSPGRTTVLDVASDGQTLISDGRLRLMMAYRDGLQSADRMLSWLDASVAADISADGATLVFDEQGEGSGARGYATYLRRLDGAAPIRLGDGAGGSLSPDGQRVAVVTVGDRPSVTILPTGAGESLAVARGPIASYDAVAWMPDGQAVVFAGHEPAHGARLYLERVKDGTPRAVSPDGYTFPAYTAPVSPDGRTVVAANPGGQLALVSLGDGALRPLPGAQSGDAVLRWTADGTAVFVLGRHDSPPSIWRIAVSTGRRDFVLALAPSDRAGYSALVSVQITPDGRRVAYSFGQNLMDLYLVRGLR
jgi:Tol biopolymer transport system component